jgi:RNA polymerase sigma factor (sigma-70 family)
VERDAGRIPATGELKQLRVARDPWLREHEQRQAKRQRAEAAGILTNLRPVAGRPRKERRRPLTLDELETLGVTDRDRVDGGAASRRAKAQAIRDDNPRRDTLVWRSTPTPLCRDSNTSQTGESEALIPTDRAPADPGILEGLVLDELVAEAPAHLRELLRRSTIEVAARAVRRDRDRAADEPGMVLPALTVNDYRRIAAQAMVAAIPRLRPDEPPGRYLRVVGRNAIARARLRDPAARPLGLTKLPEARSVPVLELDTYDLDDNPLDWETIRPFATADIVDRLVELRRVLERLSGRQRRILEAYADGRSNGEIAKELDVSLTTIKRDAARVRAALEAVGLR